MFSKVKRYAFNNLKLDILKLGIFSKSRRNLWFSQHYVNKVILKPRNILKTFEYFSFSVLPPTCWHENILILWLFCVTMVILYEIWHMKPQVIKMFTFAWRIPFGRAPTIGRSNKEIQNCIGTTSGCFSMFTNNKVQCTMTK